MLVVADPGNGVVDITKDGKKVHHFLSVRAEVTGRTLGLDDEEKVAWSAWNGRRFAFGEQALKAPHTAMERHKGAERYGREFQLSLVMHGMSLAKVPSGDHQLVLFAPPKYLAAAKPLMEDWVGKEYSIYPDGSRKALTYCFSSVHVLSEGVAGVYALCLDAKGKPNENAAELMTGRTVVIDGGNGTVDIIPYDNGKANLEKSDENTFARYGIREQVLVPVLNELGMNGITTEHVDAILAKGVMTGDWNAIVNGSVINTRNLFEYRLNDYANFIMNNLFSVELHSLEEYDRAILIGGMDLLIGDRLREAYSKIAPLKKYAKGISPLDMNVVGGYKIGLSQGWA